MEQYWGTTGVVTAIYIDTIPLHIVTAHLRGRVLIPGTADLSRPMRARRAKAQEASRRGWEIKNYISANANDGGRATASKQRALAMSRVSIARE